MRLHFLGASASCACRCTSCSGRRLGPMPRLLKPSASSHCIPATPCPPMQAAPRPCRCAGRRRSRCRAARASARRRRRRRRRRTRRTGARWGGCFGGLFAAVFWCSSAVFRAGFLPCLLLRMARWPCPPPRPGARPALRAAPPCNGAARTLRGRPEQPHKGPPRRCLAAACLDRARV